MVSGHAMLASALVLLRPSAALLPPNIARSPPPRALLADEPSSTALLADEPSSTALLADEPFEASSTAGTPTLGGTSSSWYRSSLGTRPLLSAEEEIAHGMAARRLRDISQRACQYDRGAGPAA